MFTALLLSAVVSVSPTTHEPVMQACLYDDGGVAPGQVNERGGWACAWDAKHQGNGRGHSFIAISKRGADPRVEWISHRTAHMLLH